MSNRGPRRCHHTGRHGSHGSHRRQLRPARIHLSIGRLRLHLRKQWHSSAAWIRGRLGHAFGLHRDSAVLRSLWNALAQRALPWMPLWAGAALFAGGITLLNLRGIRSTAKINELLLVMMFIVLGAFIVFAVRYICLGHGLAGLFSIRPFYNPEHFQRAKDWCGNLVCRSYLSRIRRG